MEMTLTLPVEAPSADVWQLFVDVERWPEMTASVLEVNRLDEGPVRVGSEALVKQPGFPPARWRVTELDPDRLFTWETRAVGVVTAGVHLVEPAEGGSLITLTLRQHGPLAGFARVLVGARARRYLHMEIEGFKRTAETRCQPMP